MQKKFIIIENDRPLSSLIEEQVSTFFKKNFNIKFFKNYDINGLNKTEKLDLIILNFKFFQDNFKTFINLENKNNSKIIIIFDTGVDRAQFKKYSKYRFVVKPFRLKQLIDIIKDYFVSYNTHQKNIKITDKLIFRPETKILLDKDNDVTINLTEKESKLLNFILENKEKVIKKEEILINVWGISEKINTHTLETHIYSLKKKLDTFKYNHAFINSDNLGGYYFNNF